MFNLSAVSLESDTVTQENHRRKALYINNFTLSFVNQKLLKTF